MSSLGELPDPDSESAPSNQISGRHMTIECPICDPRSAASQKRLREIARLGIARLLTVAHKTGVELTTEQQRQIFEAILE